MFIFFAAGGGVRCGPFLKALLNPLQYCFCCLCSGFFFAMRHVGS